MPTRKEQIQARRAKEKWERDKQRAEEKALLDQYIRRKAFESDLKREQEAKVLREWLAQKAG